MRDTSWGPSLHIKTRPVSLIILLFTLAGGAGLQIYYFILHIFNTTKTKPFDILLAWFHFENLSTGLTDHWLDFQGFLPIYALQEKKTSHQIQIPARRNMNFAHGTENFMV